MTFAAQHSVAYCNPSLRAAPGSSEPAQPPSNASAPPLSLSITVPGSSPAPGRSTTAVVVSSVAAAAAIAMAPLPLLLSCCCVAEGRGLLTGTLANRVCRCVLRSNSRIFDIRPVCCCCLQSYRKYRCLLHGLLTATCCHDGMLDEMRVLWLFDRERAIAGS